MAKRLTKGHLYLLKEDGHSASKLVTNGAGYVRSEDEMQARRLAEAFAAHFPACRFEVRAALSSKALGPILFACNGAHFPGSNNAK